MNNSIPETKKPNETIVPVTVPITTPVVVPGTIDDDVFRESFPHYTTEILSDIVLGCVLGIFVNTLANIIGRDVGADRNGVLAIQLALIIVVMYILKVDSRYLNRTWRGSTDYGVIFTVVFLSTQRNVALVFNDILAAQINNFGL